MKKANTECHKKRVGKYFWVTGISWLSSIFIIMHTTTLYSSDYGNLSVFYIKTRKLSLIIENKIPIFKTLVKLDGKKVMLQ